MSGEVILAADNLSRRHRGKVWLDGYSLELRRGHIYGLIGAPKSGKTMLLRALLGMIRLDSGTIEWLIDRRSVGAQIDKPVYQRDLNIRRNLEVKARLSLKPPEQDDVLELMERLSLTPKTIGERYMDHILVNERDLAGIAIAALGTPDLLILDDPNISLDGEWRERVYGLFREDFRNKTVLLTSQSQSSLSEIVTDFLYIEGGRRVER